MKFLEKKFIIKEIQQIQREKAKKDQNHLVQAVVVVVNQLQVLTHRPHRQILALNQITHHLVNQAGVIAALRVVTVVVVVVVHRVAVIQRVVKVVVKV
jgi:hypothetical protein